MKGQRRGSWLLRLWGGRREMGGAVWEEDEGRRSGAEERQNGNGGGRPELEASAGENFCGADAPTRTGRLATSHIRSTFHLLMAFFYKGFLENSKFLSTKSLISFSHKQVYSETQHQRDFSKQVV